MIVQSWLPAIGLCLFLFALNAWICHRLFSIEFTHLESNAAAFISIARFFRNHWSDLRWFPWFDGGMPIENAYQPVLPALTAAISAATRLSPGRSFHLLLAFVYCLGPVTLFWFAWDWSHSLRLSFVAGLVYSLVSPAPMLIPIIRVYPAGIWSPQRLFNLVHYGEGPHILALTLLPLAFLCLRRVIVQRNPGNLIAAVVCCAAVALSNAFGAVSLAIGAFCIALALQRGFAAVALTGVAGWLWVSPWLPPTLVQTMRRNAFTTRGFFNAEPRVYAAVAILLAVFVLIWFLTKRLTSPFERFVCLFTPWMCAFPLADFGAKITLVPQGTRYQLDMEMALCLLFACLFARALRPGNRARIAWIGALLILLIHQARIYRNFANDLIKPVEITATVEYKVAAWIDRNLPGQRTMVSGDAAYVANAFFDNPQLSGGHEPSAPNFLQQVAVYALYTGMNAGTRDAEICIFWLKAFGNQAITIPGPKTREQYMPFVNPDKFEGVLPVLWREDGDTIYGVPQRSRSLAHVIPQDAIVRRQPINSLDIEPGRTYVSALDNPEIPEATLQWTGPSRAKVAIAMKPGQVLAVQVNWDPAWHASVGGRALPIRKDGLGLMIIDPGCNGICTVDLYYGATPEIWFCRAASALVTLALLYSIASRKYTGSSDKT